MTTDILRSVSPNHVRITGTAKRPGPLATQSDCVGHCNSEWDVMHLGLTMGCGRYVGTNYTEAFGHL